MIRSRTDAKKEDRIRIVFEGGFCEQPPLDLIRMVGQTCYVVDDDLLIGLRWILEDISTEGDLLHNLADAYLEKILLQPGTTRPSQTEREDVAAARLNSRC
jgi:benzoyl-CoA reductase subunit C